MYIIWDSHIALPPEAKAVGRTFREFLFESAQRPDHAQGRAEIRILGSVYFWVLLVSWTSWMR